MDWYVCEQQPHQAISELKLSQLSLEKGNPNTTKRITMKSNQIKCTGKDVNTLQWESFL